MFVETLSIHHHKFIKEYDKLILFIIVLVKLILYNSINKNLFYITNQTKINSTLYFYSEFKKLIYFIKYLKPIYNILKP